MSYSRILLFVIASLLACTNVASAETVYKCADDTGKVVYQKEPCADALKGEKKDIDPNKNLVEGYKIPTPAPDTRTDQTKEQQKPAEVYIRRGGRRGY